MSLYTQSKKVRKGRPHNYNPALAQEYDTRFMDSIKYIIEHPDEENVIIMCSTANIMKNDGQDWRTSMSRDIPEEAFRMYLSRTNEEHNSTFISWMDDQSLCARDSRAVNTPQLHLMSKQQLMLNSKFLMYLHVEEQLRLADLIQLIKARCFYRRQKLSLV